MGRSMALSHCTASRPSCSRSRNAACSASCHHRLALPMALQLNRRCPPRPWLSACRASRGYKLFTATSSVKLRTESPEHTGFTYGRHTTLTNPSHKAARAPHMAHRAPLPHSSSTPHTRENRRCTPKPFHDPPTQRTRRLSVNMRPPTPNVINHRPTVVAARAPAHSQSPPQGFSRRSGLCASTALSSVIAKTANAETKRPTSSCVLFT